MYGEHFGLVADPFSLTPDPAFLYLSPDHREALAAVQYGLLDGRGFITLIGEVGTGKTTLLYSILGRKHAGLEAAYVSYSAQRFEDLLASALKDLHIETPATTKAGLLEALSAHLLSHDDENRSTALIIDEAQNLSNESFEELRLLSNFETYNRKLLQIVLVGQPELQDRLRQPALRQLRERVSVRAWVNPLSREQMEKYIAHRLERAGGQIERLFTPRALRVIVRRTEGIPRRANILCHNALLFAFGRHLDCVTHMEAQEAVAEMDERRPGHIRRRALRRLPFSPLAWRWAAMVGFAGVVGMTASHLWYTPPLGGHAPAPDARQESASGGVLAPGDAVAAAEAPMPAPAVVDDGSESAPAEVVGPTVPVTLASLAESGSDVAPASPEPLPTAVPAVEADGAGPSKTVSVLVPRGASLWSIMRQVYGDRFAAVANPTFYRRVLQLNPHVSDVDLIFPGDRVTLPVLPPSELAARGAE
jgi:general secretion pathway protein A